VFYMNVIEVKNLTFAYRDGETVLNDISFSVSAGEVFVIAGPSGCGKTTLCRILCGIIPHAVKGNISGQVSIMGINPLIAGLSQTALQAGFVFQDTDSQIICTTVEDELAFGLENLCWQPEEIRKRVDELIAEFGLNGLQVMNPVYLSGGQKKLLAIAAVLAPSPPILVLDEPLSGLDGDSRELVRSAIIEQRHRGRTVIIVAHDPKQVAFADRCLIIDKG
jgi:energy-coupling factor transport system ATP-binding protein